MTDKVTGSAALKSKELQQLAREYAVYLAKDFPEANCLRNEAINLNEEYVADFLRWLTSRYCVVEKEEILKQHAWYMQRMKEVSSNRQMNRGKAIALETLFGKELFEEERYGFQQEDTSEGI